MSTILSHSNERSNSSNSYSMCTFVFINFIKLEGALQPTLGSCG
jgi:hypothetical protein